MKAVLLESIHPDAATALAEAGFEVLQMRHRIAHLRDNVPGMLARINDTFGRRGVNITGQHLDTPGDVGYAIVDFESADGPALAADVAALPGTILSRLIY